MQPLRKDIERSIAGSVLLDQGAFGRIKAFLRRQSFQDSICKEVWVACELLHNENYPITAKHVRQAILELRQVDRPGLNEEEDADLAYTIGSILSEAQYQDLFVLEKNALMLIELAIRHKFIEISQQVSESDGAFYHVVCDWLQKINDYSMQCLNVLESAIAEWRRVSPDHDATHELITLLAYVDKVGKSIAANQKPIQHRDPMPSSMYQSSKDRSPRDTPPIQRKSEKDFERSIPVSTLGMEIARGMINGI